MTGDYRTLCVLFGDRLWSQGIVSQVTQNCRSVFWLGNGAAPAGTTALPIDQARSLLGRECECVIYDGRSGLDPDALGIASGLVTGGGIFLLLMPDRTELSTFNDPQNARITVHPIATHQLTRRWLERLVRYIERASALGDAQVWSPGDAVPPIKPSSRPALHHRSKDLQLTGEQARVAEAVCELPAQVEPACILLTADRGRGKSTALGHAAVCLIQRGINVVITAPSKARAAVLFQTQRAGVAIDAPFMSPDELIRSEITADLIIVDEASSLPGPVLGALLGRYPKCVFAATLHGYEGSGRGFALRFQMLLDAAHIKCDRFTLTQPVRWSPGDRVEQFFNRALLLDAEIPDWQEAPLAIKPEELQIQHLDRDQLAADDVLLSAVFGLLVEAHYQTGPMDLRQMLDGPNISLFVARIQSQPVAVVLAAREGGLDEAMMTEIQFGRRRPQGHLMPQTLAFSGSLRPSDGRLAGLRIVRIAVHPQVQRRGIGKYLLREVEQWAARQGVDYLGSSFGLTEDLLRFWQRADYAAVHLGLKRNKASALRSVMVAKPITPAARPVLALERQYFYTSFRVLRASCFADVDESCVSALQNPHGPLASSELQDRYHDLSRAVACGNRGVTLSIVALRFVLSRLDRQCLARVADQNVNFIFAVIFDLRGWPECITEFGFSGRREAEKCLRQTLRSLLDCQSEK
ncbi:MAG: tRNA(Met) cytidine acetyltransferase TmcA [Thiotrichales bacterium]